MWKNMNLNDAHESLKYSQGLLYNQKFHRSFCLYFREKLFKEKLVQFTMKIVSLSLRHVIPPGG